MKEADYIVLVIKNDVYFKEKTNAHVVKVEPMKYKDDPQESVYQQIRRYLAECFFPLFSGFHLIKSKLVKPTAIVFIDKYPSYFEYEGLTYFFLNLGFRRIQYKARKFIEMFKPEDEIKKYLNSDAIFEEVEVKN